MSTRQLIIEALRENPHGLTTYGKNSIQNYVRRRKEVTAPWVLTTLNKLVKRGAVVALSDLWGVTYFEDTGPSKPAAIYILSKIEQYGGLIHFGQLDDYGHEIQATDLTIYRTAMQLAERGEVSVKRRSEFDVDFDVKKLSPKVLAAKKVVFDLLTTPVTCVHGTTHWTYDQIRDQIPEAARLSLDEALGELAKDGVIHTETSWCAGPNK